MPERAPTNDPQGFQLDQDLGQLRREWRMQRIAWPLLYLLLLAAVLGLFGQGPLSRTQVASADGRLLIDLDRFLRRQSDDHIEFVLRPTGANARLGLSREWLREVDIERLLPEPEHRVATSEGVVFVFASPPGETLTVRLRLRAEHPGTLDGWATLDGGPPLRFSQFVYP